jgi:hypothetical protein
MARGIKGTGKLNQTKNLDGRIEEIGTQIVELKDRISILQKSRRELIALKEKENLDRLLKEVQQSGLSVDQAINVIKEKKK